MDESETASRWFQLVIRTPGSAADLMTAYLVEAGCLGVEYLDNRSPKPPRDLRKGQVEIRASFDSNSDSKDILQQVELESQRLKKLLPGPWTSVDFVDLEEEDWANSWKEHSHPVRIGRFFIHPGWVEPDPKAPFCVRIDPGMAFGTGMHPSTRMCMEWMDEIMQEAMPEGVLDVGCGSGVLAIGAAVAGADRVIAVDTDSEAVRVTKENMEHNGVSDRIAVFEGGPEAISGQYSMVLANILSGVLVELKESIVALVASDGHLVLSGILGDEGQMVREAFEEAGMSLVERRDEQEWCSLRMKRCEP